jgi:hypothetical protein
METPEAYITQVVRRITPQGPIWKCKVHGDIPEAYMLRGGVVVPYCGQCLLQTPEVSFGKVVLKKRWRPFGGSSRGYMFRDGKYHCRQCFEAFEYITAYDNHLEGCVGRGIGSFRVNDRRRVSADPSTASRITSQEGDHYCTLRNCWKVSCLFPCASCNQHFCIAHMAHYAVDTPLTNLCEVCASVEEYATKVTP